MIDQTCQFLHPQADRFFIDCKKLAFVFTVLLC